MDHRDFGISRITSILRVELKESGDTGISLYPAVEDACLAGCDDMTGDDAAERFGRKLEQNCTWVRGEPKTERDSISKNRSHSRE